MELISTDTRVEFYVEEANRGGFMVYPMMDRGFYC